MNYFNYVPTWSWTISVLAHEVGHQIGSPHTHACTWGDNWDTAIDCCGALAGMNECYGDCNAEVPTPEDGGTIMSYCHYSRKGINFNLGFGE